LTVEETNINKSKDTQSYINRKQNKFKTRQTQGKTNTRQNTDKTQTAASFHMLTTNKPAQ